MSDAHSIHRLNVHHNLNKPHSINIISQGRSPALQDRIVKVQNSRVSASFVAVLRSDFHALDTFGKRLKSTGRVTKSLNAGRDLFIYFMINLRQST